MVKGSVKFNIYRRALRRSVELVNDEEPGSTGGGQMKKPTMSLRTTSSDKLLFEGAKRLQETAAHLSSEQEPHHGIDYEQCPKSNRPEEPSDPTQTKPEQKNDADDIMLDKSSQIGDSDTMEGLINLLDERIRRLEDRIDTREEILTLKLSHTAEKVELHTESVNKLVSLMSDQLAAQKNATDAINARSDAYNSRIDNVKWWILGTGVMIMLGVAGLVVALAQFLKT